MSSLVAEGSAMVTAVARAEARIKQLSCLGLGGEAIMPALFHKLQAVVPSVSSSFYFSDESGALEDIYDEMPDAIGVVALYVEQFCNRREQEVALTFAQTMRTKPDVLGSEQLITVDPQTFYRSDLYNLVLRHFGSHDFIRLVVRDFRRPLGALALRRGPGEPSFTHDDRRRLAALQPFIAHAMTERRKTDWQTADGGTGGIIIADTAGKLVYSSAAGRRLLLLAGHPRIAAEAAQRRSLTLPPAQVRICRNLAELFSNDPSASPPVFHLRNALGAFTFRAYWLQPVDPASLIGIAVSHEEPLPIAILRRLRDIPLTHRQTQVGLLLAIGFSHSRIAQELGISKHTAIAHSRWIYDKLDVHNRAELVGRLLSGDSPALAN